MFSEISLSNSIHFLMIFFLITLRILLCYKNFEKDKLKVKSDLQIVMIDKKNKVKKIKDILFHPFFSNKVN